MTPKVAASITVDLTYLSPFQLDVLRTVYSMMHPSPPVVIMPLFFQGEVKGWQLKFSTATTRGLNAG